MGSNPLFQSGQTADAALGPGTWLAYLKPVNVEKDFIDTQYGGAYKLRYNVFVPSHSGTRRFELSELASPVFTTESKLVRRYAAISRVNVTEETDLSTLESEGYCLVQLYRKEGSNFLDIREVMPLPSRYPIPSDIGDPAAPPLEMSSQERGDIPAVESAGLSPAEWRTASGATADDEPPF